jgi:hypothetical protein
MIKIKCIHHNEICIYIMNQCFTEPCSSADTVTRLCAGCPDNQCLISARRFVSGGGGGALLYPDKLWFPPTPPSNLQLCTEGLQDLDLYLLRKTKDHSGFSRASSPIFFFYTINCFKDIVM